MVICALIANRLQKPVFLYTLIISNNIQPSDQSWHETRLTGSSAKIRRVEFAHKHMTINAARKLKELEEKLAKAEEKYRQRLSKFRGVPHESAQGELSYSDLKVWENHVETIKREIEALKRRI